MTRAVEVVGGRSLSVGCTQSDKRDMALAAAAGRTYSTAHPYTGTSCSGDKSHSRIMEK